VFAPRAKQVKGPVAKPRRGLFTSHARSRPLASLIPMVISCGPPLPSLAISAAATRASFRGTVSECRSKPSRARI
jgi:hypothetical protein